MQLNVNAGRLRHLVEFYAGSDDSDENGNPLPPTLVFSARADVEVKSGKQLIDIGEAITSQTITCLMWYDPRAQNSGFMKWENTIYEIQHVKPDGLQKGMLITAMVEQK